MIEFIFPCSIGDSVWLVEDGIFDYTDREYRCGVLEYRVVNLSWSMNKKKEVKTNVRLCLVIDGQTHDAQYNFSVEEFEKKAFWDKEIAKIVWIEVRASNNK